MLTWGILGGGALWVVEALGGEGCRHGGGGSRPFLLAEAYFPWMKSSWNVTANGDGPQGAP